MTPAAVAAAMTQQAESAGFSQRSLDGGLLLRLRLTDGVFTLDLMRRNNYPAATEAEQWRRVFRVPVGAWAVRGPVDGGYYLISYEYNRRLL